MGFSGFDPSIFGNYSNLLAQGYKDRQEMQHLAQKREDLLAQQEIENAVKQQATDYTAPKETVFGPNTLDVLDSAANLPSYFQQGAKDASKIPRPIIKVQQQVAPEAEVAVADRNPSGEASQPEMSDLAQRAAAHGLELNDKGQLVAKGGQAHAILTILDKMIGSSAAAYAAGNRAGQPIVRSGSNAPSMADRMRLQQYSANNQAIKNIQAIMADKLKLSMARQAGEDLQTAAQRLQSQIDALNGQNQALMGSAPQQALKDPVRESKIKEIMKAKGWGYEKAKRALDLHTGGK